MRNVTIVPVVADDESRGLFVRGYPIAGQFYVSNIGGSKAKIEESLCIVHWRRDQLPMRRPYEGMDGNNPVVGELEAGGRATGIFTSTEVLDINHLQIVNPRAGSPIFPEFVLYIMGWIEYSDDLGFVRRLAFCRRFDPGERRFVTMDNPDYEHAE